MSDDAAWTAMGIVGSGRRADSLARAARNQNAHVFTHGGGADAGLAALTAEASLILVSVPAEALRDVMRRLSQHLDGSHVVVHTVRGLEPGTLAPPSRIVVEESCVRKVGALLGPALADEWQQGGPTAAVVASRFPEAIQKTQGALAGAGLRVYGSKDLPGVELAGAAASVVAFALGICRERKLGATAEALLVTRGFAEVSRLAVAVGGEARSAFGLAGLGDLLVQVQEDSLAVRAGRACGRGAGRAELVTESAEVVASIATLHAVAERHKVTARLTAALHHVVHGGQGLQTALEALMALSHLPE